MGARPRPIVYLGVRYPSIGWALGDILLENPTASDQQISELLDVEPGRVQYWRARAGIPEYRKRAENPYMKEERTP